VREAIRRHHLFLALLVIAATAGCADPPEHSYLAPRWVSVATGSYHACAVSGDGEVLCWGCTIGDERWKVAGLDGCVRPRGTFATVAVEGGRTCGLRDDGTVVCWGCDSTDLTGSCDAPAGTFVDLVAGRTHACGLGADGRAVCWGCGWEEMYPGMYASDFGQCAAPGGPFVELVAGEYLTCGLRADGRLRCWGVRLGVLDWYQDERFVQIDIGPDGDLCGLRADGSLSCCSGEAEPPPFPLVRLEVGATGWCGLAADGRATCRDNGADLESGVPEGEFTDLDVGTNFACAIDTDGIGHCWGHGQAVLEDLPAAFTGDG